ETHLEDKDIAKLQKSWVGQTVRVAMRLSKQYSLELAENICAQQTAGLKEATVFSVALDESVDVNDIPRLAVMLRPRGRKRKLSQKKWQQVPQKPPQDLGVMASRGVNIAIQWADGKIIPAGQSRDVQLSSLRKKIREHKNSAAHNEAVKILQTANKDILLNMNASSQESVFESTAKASVDGDMEPIAFPLDLVELDRQHAVNASQAEEVMEFKGEELRVGRSPIIDSAQFIRAVADNMKERLFTTTANRAQASVAANRKEAYNSLINQMAVLNPDNWDHDNPRFGDNEVRALCDVQHVNQQEAHLGFTEYKASGGRNIPNKMKKLLMAVDTLSPSNADCERGFSTMNNVITEYRSKLTTKNAANLLFISSVGPPCRQWDPLPYVKTWLGKGRRAAHSTSCMARRYTEEESYFSPLWKMWKSV
ncbi:hypothetical protein JOQ06_028841, partial [Pogonophryne albipinna]